jgi:hypothetical protein
MARVRSPAVVEAFANVPREHFAGPGPWRPWYVRDYWTTQDADPRHLCHDVLVAIDEARRRRTGCEASLRRTPCLRHRHHGLRRRTRRRSRGKTGRGNRKVGLCVHSVAAASAR